MRVRLLRGRRKGRSATLRPFRFSPKADNGPGISLAELRSVPGDVAGVAGRVCCVHPASVVAGVVDPAPPVEGKGRD